MKVKKPTPVTRIYNLWYLITHQKWYYNGISLSDFHFLLIKTPTKHLCIFVPEPFFLAPNLHTFSAKCRLCIKFGDTRDKFALNYVIILIFGTNLVSKISDKAPYLMPDELFLIQIRCTFNAHFSWDMRGLIFLLFPFFSNFD